jgi:hypothetical protein
VGNAGPGPSRPDGFEDLVLAFAWADIASAQPNEGESVHAVIEGTFEDGTFFWSDEGIQLRAGE